MSKGRLLLVEDDPLLQVAVRRFLEIEGYDVAHAGTCSEAERACRSDPPDGILLDQVLPDGQGIDLLKRLKAIAPTVPVIMLTAHGSIEMAVQAIKHGAEQFLTKPADLQALRVLLERLLVNERLRRRQLAGRSLRDRERLDPFQGTSEAIAALGREARRLLPADGPVLIFGETGTGKGVLARWLHDNGRRAEESFVDLNCAGLSRDLVETELFGHEAGAFTGAAKPKAGLLEVADKGTFFLDEVGDTQPAVQAKLLKVIEEKSFRRLGDTRDRQVDVRLIAATHRDLISLSEEGRFRSDLLFRINTFTLVVPPLRDRREDIPLLASTLVERFVRELGRDVVLSGDALAALRGYAWPGNVRELRNVLERAVFMTSEGVIRPEDIRFMVGGGGEPSAGRAVSLDEVERRHIRSILEAEGGNVEGAARLLQISKSSLYQRLKRFKIPPFDS